MMANKEDGRDHRVKIQAKLPIVLIWINRSMSPLAQALSLAGLVSGKVQYSGNHAILLVERD
jgi:hypothetical protein